MIAVVPGYISRSVAGSYDNEGEFVTPKETFKDCWVLESGAGRCYRTQESLCPFLVIPAGFVLSKPDPSGIRSGFWPSCGGNVSQLWQRVYSSILVCQSERVLSPP